LAGFEVAGFEVTGFEVIAVVGQTASGKSDLAVELAQRIGGAVINADAMQLYRGMDIGTAKLPQAERRGVEHHLLDVLEVSDEASVAAYQAQARAVADGLIARGLIPIYAGGSGLYLRAALDALQIPPTDPAVRERWEREAERVGIAALHAELSRRDPAAGANILPTNARRVVRALEVIEVTGRPFSATLPDGSYLRPTLQLGLRVPRPQLDQRITRRVDRMWEAGLVEETRELVVRGLREGRTASRALGYAQVLRYLDGACTEDEARGDTVTATRRFSRRQESWFRRDQRIHWFDASDDVARARLLDSASAARVRRPVAPA